VNESVCLNCQSRRRRVYRRQLCSKCYHWQRKLESAEQSLAAISPSHRFREAASFEIDIRRAKRVLEEYAWRERHLNADDVDPLVLEGLAYAVAGECRSEITFALQSLFEIQSSKARKCVYLILLDIVENIPSRTPRLHTLTPPKKGTFPSAWREWSISSLHERLEEKRKMG
jgi:hypothetical protein